VVGHKLLLLAHDPSGHKIYDLEQEVEMISTIVLQYSLDF